MIPGFLGSIAQYRPIQTGAALAWVAIPQFVLVWLVAISTVFIQPRVVMAGGIRNHCDRMLDGRASGFRMGGRELRGARTHTGYGNRRSICRARSELYSLLAAEMGAATNIVNASTYAAWMHTMRLLGGEVGAVVFSRFVTVREQLHSNLLGYHVAAGNWITDDGYATWRSL